MKFALFLLALPAFANTTFELSSNGATGSANGTQFTIAPFDIIVPIGSTVTFTVGEATLPDAAIDSPTFAGDISYQFGALDIDASLWVMADTWNAPAGELQWGLQNDSGGWVLDPAIYGDDEATVDLMFSPVVAPSGSSVAFTLTAEVHDAVPEPGTWLVGVPLVLYAAWRIGGWLVGKAFGDSRGKWE